MIFRHHAILILTAQCATAFLTPNSASTRPQVQSASSFAFVPKNNVRLFSDVADATEDAAPAEAEVEAPVEVEAAVAEETTEEEPAAAEEEAEEPKETFTIYVGNLNYEMTDSEITELFEQHGTVSKVTVPQNKFGEGSRGFAFVDMASREDLEKACEALDQTEMGGRTVYVSESVPREKGERKKPTRNRVEGTKLYVGNLSFDTSADTLREFFGQYGNIIDVYIPFDQARGMSRGYAFVTLGKEDAEKAIDDANGQELEGRSLTVNESLPRGQKAPRKPRVEGTKLYVGNLSFDTAEEDLRYLFEEFGDIIDCYMPKDRDTGRARGFAFVTMEHDAAMRAADETDGCEMDGRILRVNEAQPKGSSNGGGGYNDGDSWGNDSDDSWGNESY
mmetsp:Transcript_10258/g.14331  ORF Transcript_10258/g.14331 Transcript_10258/m.14331 type:complete len:391 (-) Transcript_10258:197-1369(-)|eukprot:CAMPEP_0185732820 /NCGR_PEP_ID=MMETSP1171-20130828/17607_1 /TAXON_ID=374046 /ORGANISM="Helicotheca tamensis, Strain CCMP826" /LENGTH=390 /DNA_ID=CAMNT_0028402403 /DNA_START=81 /DNA_END=1253 /DNA_ORIENTATION=-